MTDLGIVVGINGSPSSFAALGYAAAEATVRGLDLTVIHGWESVPLLEGALLIPTADVELAEAGVLADADDKLEEIAPRVKRTSQLIEGNPSGTLIQASKNASLIVLGCHQGSSAWLGPVLGHLATRAHCPVVAVPAGAPGHAGDVVVGVDGSEVSLQALEYAFAQASLWRRDLVPVLAASPSFDAFQPDERFFGQLTDRGTRYLSEALSGSSERYPDVKVRQVVSRDRPFTALRDAAKDAGLVVVGSHGRGAVLRMALGSVSSSLLRAAPCPVAVVRPTEPEAE